MEKADIGIALGKKFFNAEKKRNPNFDDAAAHEAATHRFLGTLWLLNPAAPETLKSNLVQAYISGDDRYPTDVERAFAMVEAKYQAPPGDTRRSHTSLAQSSESTNHRGRGGVLDMVLVVVVVMMLAVGVGLVQPQTVGTGAGIVAADSISSGTALIMLTLVHKKKLLR